LEWLRLPWLRQFYSVNKLDNTYNVVLMESFRGAVCRCGTAGDDSNEERETHAVALITDEIAYYLQRQTGEQLMTVRRRNDWRAAPLQQLYGPDRITSDSCTCAKRQRVPTECIPGTVCITGTDFVLTGDRVHTGDR